MLVALDQTAGGSLLGRGNHFEMTAARRGTHLRKGRPRGLSSPYGAREYKPGLVAVPRIRVLDELGREERAEDVRAPLGARLVRARCA